MGSLVTLLWIQSGAGHFHELFKISYLLLEEILFTARAYRKYH